jgi:hypothetical protein
LLPLTLFSPNGGTIQTLVSDGTTLYLGAQTGLFSLPVAGGPLTTLFGQLGVSNTTSGVSSFWSSGSSVRFINQQSYLSVPKAGGSPTTIGSVPNAYGDAVTDGTTVYFITNMYGHSSDGSVDMQYSLASIPVAGGSSTPILTFDGKPDYLLLSDGSLYWIEASSGIFASGPIYQLPVTGGTPKNTGIQAWSSQLAADDSYLYFSSVGNGIIPGPVMRVPKNDLTAAPTQVSNLGGQWLAVEGSQLFGLGIVGPNALQAWKTPAAGGNATILFCAPDDTTLQGFGVDATNVYVGLTASSSHESGVIAVPHG